jgi:hypothetical protein
MLFLSLTHSSQYPPDRWLGEPQNVWKLQRGQNSLAPDGNQTYIPWSFSQQLRHYTERGITAPSSVNIADLNCGQMQILQKLINIAGYNTESYMYDS